MKLSDIPVPDVYKRESSDFRFFLKWFEEALQKVKYDHEHAFDLYDPLRCPRQLLWMLADTMGYKYDDRLPPSFCRLVLLYFMSMIRLKGSKNGVMLAAEVNLAQFSLLEYGKEKEILYDRLEDTSVPVNSVSVIQHVDDGYIDVVYFSDKKPIDACIEYVRPLGMFLFPRAGVTIHSRTRIWVDGRLTSTPDMKLSFGPTQIGHYSREDYARLQKMRKEHEMKVESKFKKDYGVTKVKNYRDPNNLDELDESVGHDSSSEAISPQYAEMENNTDHIRRPMWRRNQKYEVTPDGEINPGYRALYSLQLSNNEHIVKSMLKPMFTLGYGPHEGDTESDEYYRENQDIRDDRPWDIKNLRYEENNNAFGDGWSYLDDSRTSTNSKPKPRLNPSVLKIGDAIPMNPYPLEEYDNEKYTKSSDPDNKGRNIEVKNRSDV